ncbi:MAG: hypothetical protein GY737_16355 [Desulfobacteraceae bacterium]|nr:hypothetical protein [Desulfobacteraceae bacterium]
MEFNLNVTQKHVLFSLLFTGEEPAMSKTTPPMPPKRRKELVDAGLIQLEKRGRAQHIVLTEKAWAWAFEALDQEVSGRLKLNAGALEGLLRRLKSYMVKNGVGFAELLGSDQAVLPETKSLEDRVRSAYHEIAGFEWNVRVRIADLRGSLSDVTHDELSAVLRRMQLSDDWDLVLYPYDDPREIRPGDSAAAVEIAGQENHIIYLGE